jgi:hypothetical protein
MRVTAASIDPRAALPRLRTTLSTLANDLYRLEAEPDLQTAMNREWVSGDTADMLGDRPELIPSLWQRYPTVANAIDEIAKAVAADDLTTAAALLAPGGLRLDDGTAVTLTDLLDDLRRDTTTVLMAAERIAAARRDTAPRLDAAAAVLARTAEVARDSDAEGDPALLAAEQLVESYRTLATTDPLSVNLTVLDQAVERARTRVEEAVESRRSLSQRLLAARTLLDELAELVPEGRAALEETTRKVSDAPGLLQPLDWDQLDGGPHGLTPWLERLEKLAHQGQWQPLAEGLKGWESVARGWLQNAESIVVANRAPLEQRNELRGLLDAYASKATAIRTFEHPEVAHLYQQATDVLSSAPCPLGEAAELVRRYGQAVSQARHPQGRPPMGSAPGT